MRELGGHHAPEVCVHMYDTRIGRQFSRAKEEEITDCVTSTAVLSNIGLSFSDFLPVQEFIWRYFHYTEFSNESCKHQGENRLFRITDKATFTHFRNDLLVRRENGLDFQGLLFKHGMLFLKV